MAFHRAPKPKPKSTRSPILLLVAAVTAIALLFLFSSLLSTAGSKPSLFQRRQQQFEKYLYWGNRIDCPGKHCGSCEGLGHQESSLRCALEEAIFLGRTFVLPSRMCINPIHNKKGILHHSANGSSEELWDASSCAMDSLYDTELMSGTVPVIFDNSKEWYRVLSTSMKLGTRGVEHVEGVSRFDLKENSHYSDMLLINRTASPLSCVWLEWINFSDLKLGPVPNAENACLNLFVPNSLPKTESANSSMPNSSQRNREWLALSYYLKPITIGSYVVVLEEHLWGKGDTGSNLGITKGLVVKKAGVGLQFLPWNNCHNDATMFMECKDRNNRSSILLPYSFLPSMAAGKLREAAEKIKALLGDYDAIHVRRGDKIKTRKDRFGVARSLHPHLDRDTRPEFIICRIAKWVPPGRTLFIASNERTPGFFSPLSARYRLAYSSNYSHILDPLIENNYQLFMIERLIMMGAKTFIRTFKEDETDLSLTDDPKKNTKLWQVPVYNADETC
ncbi:uncharacterized protein HKW66_Vig0185870 [Vigna angularis]|uniref:O-fucosyltransferase family protein n=1 Tax=Phaseolus angularis TaxID=3914 RepID=A0A8T0KST0_PHAAN|nr:uncharacterized protein HKW66_Vig0185870 [Vigna angularis]